MKKYIILFFGLLTSFTLKAQDDFLIEKNKRKL